MKKLSVVLLMVLLLMLIGCGGNNNGKNYEGRWEARVVNGFKTQTVTYDIKHVSGNEYLITIELDGLKQDRTIMAVYENDSFRLPPFGDEAVMDGKERMLLQGMDFKKVQ